MPKTAGKAFSLGERTKLIEELTGLPSALVDENGAAKRFDYLPLCLLHLHHAASLASAAPCGIFQRMLEKEC